MLTLHQAQTIINATFAEARARALKPLAAVVLDAGGHPIAFAREDCATIFRLDIARAKAMGAIGMGVDSRVLSERAKSNPLFHQSVSAVVDSAIAFSPGGVLIREGGGGAPIGAVGVSGDTGDMDEACALAGISAAGLSGGEEGSA